MRTNILKKILTMTLAFAMVFTMIPLLATQAVDADTATAPGGDVCIGSDIAISTIKSAFDNAVSATYTDGDEETLTITLNKDIKLSDPLNLYRASTSGKKCTMTINLNGHSITGAEGKDAIKLYSVLRFYVEIVGPGTVKGGTGAVCTNESYRYGGEGGYGINVIAARSDYIEYDLLKCGLTIKGGATVEGGAGASLVYDDWLYNVNNASGEDKLKCHAGDGGCGIGSDARDGNNFIRYDIQNGTVKGGEGGSINIGDNIINFNSMMKIAKFKEYYSGRTYGCGLPSFVQGNGGDGLRFYGGRTYINISAQGSIIGGDGGAVSQGDTAVQVSDVMQGSTGDGGDGIDLYGNACLGGTSPSYTSAGWQNASGSISSDSQYMGLYIAGTVKGGSTKNVILKSQSGLNGGNGISLHPYTGAVRGIIAIDNSGIVSGGDGGNGLRGSAGTGGNGIKEDGSEQINRFGKYYLINGTVAGGSGGDSWASIGNAESIGSNGGHGFNMNIRADDANDEVGVRTIAGSGSISGGASGSVLAEGSVAERKGQEAMYYGSSWSYVDQVVKVSQNVKINKGTAPTVTNNSTYSKGISAKASISDRNLKCEVTAPGFSGKRFISWSVATYQQSGDPNNGWPIETGTSNYSNFTLLNNSDYQNCLKNTTDVATVERIANDLQYNRTSAKIFCTVVLEDGRYVQCEPIQLPALWNGNGNYSGGESGGGSGDEDDPTQDDIDAESALYVTQLIDAIPATVTLDDADAVNEAWEAYEALNDNAKGKVWPDSVQKLKNAKTRIEELEKESVDGILKQIKELESAECITAENAQAVKSKIDEIRRLIDALTPEEQAMLASSENAAALGKLDATEQKVTKVISGTATHTHLMQHVVAKEATCSTEGNIEHYKCMTCGEKYANAEGTGDVLTNVTTPTDSSKHKYGAWKNVKAPTCTAEGSKERVCEHNATHKETESIPIDPNAHSWDGGRVTKQPAVGVAGVRTYTCNWCHKTRTESIAALPQPYVAPAAPAEIQDLPYVKASKPAKGKKAITVKWKKVKKKNQKKIGGIEIQVTGPGVNMVVTAGKKKSSKKIKGLLPKQKYSCRVRAYNYIGGVKHVSAWSNWKTAKTK